MARANRHYIPGCVGKKKAVCVIGWGLTKSGKAYKVEWTTNDLVIIPLSQSRAEQRGYKEFATKCTFE